MLRAESVKLDLIDNRVTRAIDRYRYFLFAGVAFLLLITFNGRWRVGIDSAIYRGLAISLVQGKGFVFGEEMGKRVYPGWPYALAAVEYVFGPSDRTASDAEQARLLGPSAATTVSVLLVQFCAILTIVLVYRLIALHYARWIAVTIACGVGSNAVFLQHSHELLTDVPFLLGVVMSLYGWDLLQQAQTNRGRALAMLWIIPGLVMTANLRPVFWVLAGSWAAVCVVGLIRGPRGFHAACLGILLCIGLVRFGFHPFSGGYEMEALDLAPRASDTLWQRLFLALHDQIPASFFGEQLAPASMLASLVLLFSAYFLLGRHLLWALLIWGLFIVTLVTSTVPRYYMTILPPLLLGWLFSVCWLARRMPGRWPEIVLAIGLALVTLNNLSRSVRLVIEQRSSNFFKAYKGGDYLPTLEWAAKIRKSVRPDQNVLGPWGNILSVLTGRHVFTQRELLPHGKSLHNPFEVKQANLAVGIFPSDWYRRKDPVIAQLMEKRVISPFRLLDHGPKNSYLATVVVTLPPSDWRTLSRTWRPPASAYPLHPAERRRRIALRASRAAAAAAKAATQPSSQPSTQPATFRATTTMLSPDWDPANSDPLSLDWEYDLSDEMLDAAFATSDSASPWRTVSFLTEKYIAAATPASPIDLSRLITPSFADRDVATLP